LDALTTVLNERDAIIAIHPPRSEPRQENVFTAGFAEKIPFVNAEKLFGTQRGQNNNNQLPGGKSS
jgi:hypothetical protein